MVKKKIYPTQLSGKIKVHDLMPRSLKCIFHEFIFVSRKKKEVFFPYTILASSTLLNWESNVNYNRDS